LLMPVFFFALDLGVWHWSFELTSVANATLEANCAVVLAAAVSWRWLKDKFSGSFPVRAAPAVVGIARLLRASFGAGGRAWSGAPGVGRVDPAAGARCGARVVEPGTPAVAGATGLRPDSDRGDLSGEAGEHRHRGPHRRQHRGQAPPLSARRYVSAFAICTFV